MLQWSQVAFSALSRWGSQAKQTLQDNTFRCYKIGGKESWEDEQTGLFKVYKVHFLKKGVKKTAYN